MTFSDYLAEVAGCLSGKPKPGTSGDPEYEIRCPYPDRHKHNDRNRSAWMGSNRWSCSACSADGTIDELAAMVGVTRHNGQKSYSVADLAEEKGYDRKLLAQWGCRDADNAVVIEYRGPVGQKLRDKIRGWKSDGSRYHGWSNDGFDADTAERKMFLYGLDRVTQSGDLLLVEGETDVWACWHHGIWGVLGVPGAENFGAATDVGEFMAWLGKRQVYIWKEHGLSGQTFVSKTGPHIPGAQVIEAPEEADDLADMHRAVEENEDFVGWLAKLKTDAVAYDDMPVMSLASVTAAARQGAARGVVEALGDVDDGRLGIPNDQGPYGVIFHKILSSSMMGTTSATGWLVWLHALPQLGMVSGGKVRLAQNAVAAMTTTEFTQVDWDQGYEELMRDDPESTYQDPVHGGRRMVLADPEAQREYLTTGKRRGWEFIVVSWKKYRKQSTEASRRHREREAIGATFVTLFDTWPSSVSNHKTRARQQWQKAIRAGLIPEDIASQAHAYLGETDITDMQPLQTWLKQLTPTDKQLTRTDKLLTK